MTELESIDDIMYKLALRDTTGRRLVMYKERHSLFICVRSEPICACAIGGREQIVNFVLPQ